MELLDTQRTKPFPDCGDAPEGVRLRRLSFQYLINFPVLKGHCQNQAHLRPENLKGLLPDSEKRRFHTLGLSKPIAHLNAGLRQDFIFGGRPLRRLGL